MRSKRLVTTILCLSMALSVGCGVKNKGKDTSDKVETPIVETATKENETETAVDLPLETSEETPSEPVSNSETREIPSELAEKYKLFTEKYDNKVLIGMEAKDVLQLYIKAAWDKDFETEYYLFNIPEEAEDYTLDMHLAIPENERGNREAMEKNLLPALDGVFIDNGDNTGYVLYNIDENEAEGEIRLDMSKDDDGVWKVYYNPNIG